MAVGRLGCGYTPLSVAVKFPRRKAYSSQRVIHSLKLYDILTGSKTHLEPDKVKTLN